MGKFVAITLVLATAVIWSACGDGGSSCVCAAGQHCDRTQTCVPDSAPIDAAVPADLAVVMPDMAVVGCNPPCGAQSRCNASFHCVACLADEDCPAGDVCKQINDRTAACVLGCKDDARCKGLGATQACCGMGCVDTAKDVLNCGACGTVCKAPHAQALCTAGVCSVGPCDAGWGDCNGNPMDGCETNLRVDMNNCQKCGSTCRNTNAVSACSDGCYITACNFGFDDCNQDPMDGCETSVLADGKNCGACGTDCNSPPLAHAKAGCSNAACQIISCDQGWLDCDGNWKNGCETSSVTDANNCGACKNVCGQGLVCKGGGCTCPNCAIPNASAKCVNFVCLFDKCNPGYADCNGNIKDGCEVTTASDSNNCGACGVVCPMNMAYCNNGVCTKGVDYGPMHTFVNQTSDFFLSTGQGCCSVNCAGNQAVDAAYFCQHFYGTPNNMNCVASDAGVKVNQSGWMMHKNGGCTSSGTDIPNLTCDAGACKMWNSGPAYSGLKGIICHCM